MFGVFEVIARKGDRLTLVPAYVLARLASACPETVDAVYRLVLGRPEFEWVADGDALLRLRKPE